MNFMIDIETSGLDAGKHFITSCAVLPFDLDFDGVHKDVFHERFNTYLEGRVWNDDTTKFRDKHGITEAEGNLRLRDNLTGTLMAMRNFMNDYVEMPADIYVWAKPTNFDIAFLESYYRQKGMEIPWPYRNVRDLGTYLMAANHKLVDLYEEIKMTGDAHNALHDCQYQILLAQFGYRSLHPAAPDKKLAG